MENKKDEPTKQERIDIIKDFESLDLDPFTSDKAVIEHVIRKHLTKKYSSKILNQPLIDKILVVVRKMLYQLKVNSIVKEKILKNINQDLSAKLDEMKKLVDKKLKEMKKEEKKNPKK